MHNAIDGTVDPGTFSGSEMAGIALRALAGITRPTEEGPLDSPRRVRSPPSEIEWSSRKVSVPTSGEFRIPTDNGKRPDLPLLLKAFLDERFSELRYLGIDQMPEFIDTARHRHGALPDAAFALGRFDTLALPRADIVVASGALGYHCQDPRWVFNVIARMYAAAERVLVFNVLDAMHFPDNPLLVGRDVDDLAAFCRKLAPRVEVARGYAIDDATIVMRTAATFE